MRFLMFYRPAQSPAQCAPPPAEHMEEMSRFIEQMKKEGVLIETGAILPREIGARVRRTGTEFTVTNGAFPDLAQPFVGFALIHAASKEEAIASSKRFLAVAGDGENEILQLMDAPP